MRLIPAAHRQGVVAYDPSTQEVDEGGTGVQRHSWLHGKLEISLRYRTPCQKKK